MGQDVALLVIGVVLTGLVGGGITHWFQSRAWSNQQRVAARATEREEALAFYQQCSERFDRRLYRMRSVNWVARALDDQRSSLETFDEVVQSYRQVLDEWNETINRVNAFAEIYFGTEVRRCVEGIVYEEFAGAGRALDLLIRCVRNPRPDGARPRIEQRLDRLGQVVFDINVLLLGCIRDGHYGSRPAPVETSAISVARPYAELGDDGANVTRLQRALIEHGALGLDADGSFGLQTWSAVRDTQERHGLRVDGVANPETVRTLGLSTSS